MRGSSTKLILRTGLALNMLKNSPSRGWAGGGFLNTIRKSGKPGGKSERSFDETSSSSFGFIFYRCVRRRVIRFGLLLLLRLQPAFESCGTFHGGHGKAGPKSPASRHHRQQRYRGR